MQIARGVLTKRNTINLNAKTTEDVTRVQVTSGLAGVHWDLANRYATPDAPAWQALHPILREEVLRATDEHPAVFKEPDGRLTAGKMRRVEVEHGGVVYTDDKPISE